MPRGLRTASDDDLETVEDGVIVTSATAYIQSASFWNFVDNPVEDLGKSSKDALFRQQPS